MRSECKGVKCEKQCQKSAKKVPVWRGSLVFTNIVVRNVRNVGRHYSRCSPRPCSYIVMYHMCRFQVSVQKGHAPRPMPHAPHPCSYIVRYHMCRFQVSVQKGHAPRPHPCSYIVRYHLCRFQVPVQKGHAPRPTPHAPRPTPHAHVHI